MGPADLGPPVLPMGRFSSTILVFEDIILFISLHVFGNYTMNIHKLKSINDILQE